MSGKDITEIIHDFHDAAIILPLVIDLVFVVLILFLLRILRII